MATEEQKRTLKYGEVIDSLAFDQILEMDDDETHEFSKQIVFDFFDQANTTFKTMQQALKSKDLHELSNLGHFLKGSSATLGLIKVKDSCEKIQNYGAGKNATGTSAEPDNEKSLSAISSTLKDAMRDYSEAEKVLKNFYDKEAK